ncbi:MAG: hypothetical protein QM773_10080 [Hyphomonadaceae bacterium]
MIRKIVAAGLGSLVLASLPAVAQEVPAQDMPELDGAPPPLKIPVAKPKSKVTAPKVAPAKPVPAKQTQVKPEAAKPKTAPIVAADKTKPAAPADDKLKAAQLQLAKQAEAQTAEKTRLDKQAADLRAQQDSLEARITLLSAREKGVEDREADLAAQKAELDRQRKDVAAQAAKLAAADDGDKPETKTYSRTGLDRGRAVEACERAGDDEARARSYYSAEYNSAPYFSFGQTWQVRGRMRIEGRIGYKIVDTVCDIDEDGEAQRFTFLR